MLSAYFTIALITGLVFGMRGFCMSDCVTYGAFWPVVWAKMVLG